MRLRFGPVRRNPRVEVRLRFVWPVCANVVRERAFRGWTQKWPVGSANVVREKELFGAGRRPGQFVVQMQCGKEFFVAGLRGGQLVVQM